MFSNSMIETKAKEIPLKGFILYALSLPVPVLGGGMVIGGIYCEPETALVSVRPNSSPRFAVGTIRQGGSNIKLNFTHISFMFLRKNRWYYCSLPPPPV